MIHISGHSLPVLWSIIGAALFVAIIHLISRRQLEATLFRALPSDARKDAAGTAVAALEGVKNVRSASTSAVV